MYEFGGALVTYACVFSGGVPTGEVQNHVERRHRFTREYDKPIEKVQGMSNPIPKILIVEHDPTLARDLGECLKNMGYTVSATVEGSREAVEIAANARPDLALGLSGTKPVLKSPNCLAAGTMFPSCT